MIPEEICHRETKAPVPPWVLETPAVAVSSWFMSTVMVPSPLSKAPRPSGMPAIRYSSLPLFFLFTASPAVRIDTS
jgi:hypothetical protein